MGDALLWLWQWQAVPETEGGFAYRPCMPSVCPALPVKGSAVPVSCALPGAWGNAGPSVGGLCPFLPGLSVGTFRPTFPVGCHRLT